MVIVPIAPCKMMKSLIASVDSYNSKQLKADLEMFLPDKS